MSGVGSSKGVAWEGRLLFPPSLEVGWGRSGERKGRWESSLRVTQVIPSEERGEL